LKKIIKTLGKKTMVLLLALTVFMTGCAEREEPDRYPDDYEDRQAEFETSEAGNTQNIRTEMEKETKEISELDNTSQGWGPGVNYDEQNRPLGALDYQGKYGKYDADFIITEEGTQKNLYLTFDEGYENGHTGQILDVLKEKQCPAVFFVTMQYVMDEPELIRRMIDEGHTIGNHSVSHPAKGLPSLTREQQEKEIWELHEYMKENFDYEMTLFRYPAGIFSEQSLAVVRSIGYKSVFWSFAYADWDPDEQPDEKEALLKLTERLHPGAIYLLHAVSETNANILGAFIENARTAGYTFAEYETFA